MTAPLSADEVALLLGAFDRVARDGEADDPAAWITTNLAAELWSGQRAVCESVRDNRYTAVQASHGLGKSFIAAALACWHVTTREDPMVVTTAPTAAQVSSILWREVRAAHGRGGLPGRITDSGYPTWHVGGSLVGIGRKPNEYDDDTFQGIHALSIMVIIDEASGVPADLWDQVDSLATNTNARVLAIGNPTDPNSQFARVCAPASGWNTIRLDGLRSPLLTSEALVPFPELAALMAAEGVQPSTETVSERLAMLLTGSEWIAERMARWGVGSSLWVSRVRGVFPADADSDAVIPLAWVLAAQDRWLAWKDSGQMPPGRVVLGVDIGRSTDADANVVARRHGHVVTDLQSWRVKDLEQTTGRVLSMLRAEHNTTAVVDETGIGAGVLDALRAQGQSVSGFVASGKASGTDRTGEFTHFNKRAEAWWNLREALDPAHNPVLCLPPDEQLAADLTAPRWKLTRTGAIQIEAKDEIRKRLGRSPDAGDAVVLSLVQSTMVGAPAEVIPWGGGGGADPVRWSQGDDVDAPSWFLWGGPDSPY